MLSLRIIPLSRILTLLGVFSSLTTAQQILSTAPACQTCPLLVQAQQICASSVNPPSTAALNNCYCNTPSLAALKAGQTTGLCDAAYCSAADMQNVLKWFQTTICAGTAAAAAPAQTTTTATTTALTAATAVGGSKGSSNNQNKSWIQINYRWIIMVIVLILAAIIAILLGIWLKRRSARRRAMLPANRNSTLVAAEAAASLRNKHPNAPGSMTSVPGSRATSQQYLAGTAPGAQTRNSSAALGSRPSLRSVNESGSGSGRPRGASGGQVRWDKEMGAENKEIGVEPPKRVPSKLRRAGSGAAR
ncbi:hypothetical protein BT63DRAFT_455516 [Microthyrium microscopicum]|uniref:Integral membrane protein n=1 Tax=Microthyrium microscopicum TaxID=703497 RepID=A0A6A6UBA8_9PEZI|nr:hypothetical protein BT63DRAFT_455516 [Microthyrium microscopicum]